MRSTRAPNTSRWSLPRWIAGPGLWPVPCRPRRTSPSPGLLAHPRGTEDFNRFQLGAGYAFGLPKNVDAGFNLTVAGYRFMGEQRVAWGVDLGISPLTVRACARGLVVKNLLRPTFSFSDGVEDRWARRIVLASGRRRRGTAALEVEFSDRLDPRVRAERSTRWPTCWPCAPDTTGRIPPPVSEFAIKQFPLRLCLCVTVGSGIGTSHRALDRHRPADRGTAAPARRARLIRSRRGPGARRTEQRPPLEAQAEQAMEDGSWGEADVRVRPADPSVS